MKTNPKNEDDRKHEDDHDHRYEDKDRPSFFFEKF